MTMYIQACFIYLAFLCRSALSVGPIPATCPCASKSYCDPVNDWKDDKKEIMVITKQASDYKLWMWDSLSTVIEWSDDVKLNSTVSDELMCFAHSKGKKYGFYIKDLPTDGLFASSEISYKRADVVALNLIDYLGDCSYAERHIPDILNYTTTVISSIKEHTTAKLLCVMPWKPPCFEQNCDVGPALAKKCDGVIFSPESYNTYCSETCTAKPTVSYSKIIIGITEYLAAGFNKSQLLLGIPWHGYNYTCQNGDHDNKWSGHFVCHLSTKKDNATGKDVCDIEGSRRRMSVGSVVGKVPEMALLDSTFSRTDQAPFRVDHHDTVSYMTWYEDIGSLLAKYEAVGKYNIKGAVIYSGDDLTYDHMRTNKEFDDHMWSWMLHSILSTGNALKPDRKSNVAGTMAGVGIGMFLMGCLLGTIVSCVVFRRKKNLHAPFKHDMADEYTDDLDHNQL